MLACDQQVATLHNFLTSRKFPCHSITFQLRPGRETVEWTNLVTEAKSPGQVSSSNTDVY